MSTNSGPPRTPGYPSRGPPTATVTATTIAPRLSTVPSQKPRQLSHLHAQLAQLTAHVSDLENLLRMTAVQAESMRGLGGYAGGMFMAASKVLGEETVTGAGLGTDSHQESNEKAVPRAPRDGEQEGSSAT